MDFAQASQPRLTDAGTWQLVADDSWLQGRTIFGGLVAANLVNAMASNVTPEHKLRAVTVTLAGPLPVEGAQIEVTTDRLGRSSTFMSAVITIDGSVATRASAVFAADRKSKLSVPGQAPTFDRGIEEADQLPFIPGIVPNFIQHFDVRVAHGSFPYSGSPDAVIGGYCRHATLTPGVAALVALLDAWPPALLSKAVEPIASSTMQWSAHIVNPDVAVGTDWFEFGYRSVTAAAGYTISEGTMAKDGEVVAWTEQLGAVYG